MPGSDKHASLLQTFINYASHFLISLSLVSSCLATLKTIDRIKDLFPEDQFTKHMNITTK
jgi:hypothetical protein